MEDTALNHAQQWRIFDTKFRRPVTLIGAGSVGSLTAAQMAKLGVTDLTVYDDDIVSSHNVPMSAYWPEHVGRVKVEALAEIVKRTASVDIKAVPERYAGTPLSGTVVACVDTMEARQMIWKAVKNDLVDLLIDTRVAHKFISVFAIDPRDTEDIEYYEYFLRYGSKDAYFRDCGEHGVIHVAEITAGRICDVLTESWTHGRKRRHHRELIGSHVIVP